MEQKRLCPFCMGELPPAATVCPHCGKILEGCNPAGCLPVGTVLRAGAAELVVTQIGKECHTACEIRRLTGRCAMPTEGIFCVVTRGGTVRAGDSLEVVAR